MEKQYEKIKRWYNELSGASKFIILLSILLIISNISINNKSSTMYENVKCSIDNIINDNCEEILQNSTLCESFSKIVQYYKYLFFVLISGVSFYISLYVGKILGFFKSFTEFLIDIKDDGILSIVLVVYDLIGILFDVYTIFSLLQYRV